MVEVRLENLTKHFGSVRAVENLNLKINDEELIVLLGPSGCGKTTILRLIAGLERPTRGHVYFGEKCVDDVPPRFRNVSMVFQSYALFPHMKVFDNIAFPLKVARWSKRDIEERVKEVASMLKIENLLERKPHELSGGQQQRVALGRALARKPDILLLDEPLANLDAKLRETMRGELKRLQKEFKCTTVYVTHDQIEAMSMADRIAILNNGKLQQVGTPEELYNAPKNIFVASFIGTPSMNLLDCSYIEEKGILDFGSFTIKMPEDIKSSLSGHSELVFGVRPRDIDVSKNEKPNALESKVYVAEPLGEEMLITLDIKGIRIKAVSPFIPDVKIEEKLWVSFNLNKAHIFDKKGGEALHQRYNGSNKCKKLLDEMTSEKQETIKENLIRSH